MATLVSSRDADRLAEYLAREIFALGDETGNPCIRIQFKGGVWTPDQAKETDNGGVIESSLAHLIKKLLSKWMFDSIHPDRFSQDT